MSAHLDGLSTPQQKSSGKQDVVNGGGSSFRDLSSGSKAKALPPKKLFNSRLRTPINRTPSRAPQSPCHLLKYRARAQNGKSSRAGAQLSVTWLLIPRLRIQLSFHESYLKHKNFHSSHQTHQQSPKYNNKLVDEHPPSSIDPLLYRQSSYPSARATLLNSHQDATSEDTKPPSKPQRQRNVPKPLPTHSRIQQQVHNSSRPSHPSPIHPSR